MPPVSDGLAPLTSLLDLSLRLGFTRVLPQMHVFLRNPRQKGVLREFVVPNKEETDDTDEESMLEM